MFFGEFAALAVATIVLKLRSAARDRYFDLIPLAAVCGATRFAVLPTDFNRALLPCYLMVLIAFVETCCTILSIPPPKAAWTSVG